MLIAKAQAAPDADVPSDVISPEFKGCVLRRSDPFFLRVTEAAWGEACLRFSGVLPPVAPFAAGQPRLPTCERCPCMGKLTRTDIIGVIEKAAQARLECLSRVQRGAACR